MPTDTPGPPIAAVPAAPAGAAASDRARPSDPGPVTRALVRLAREAGEEPGRLAAAYAAHLRQLPAGGVVADLRALVGLAADRHPAGRGLVRGLLATAPAGHRVLAAARTFRSTRRLREGAAGAAPPDWTRRCDILGAGRTGADLALTLRGRCDALLARLVRGDALGEADRAELAALLNLEADARDERVRDLAARLVARGVDAAAVGLAQVARLDAGLADLRELIARLAADGGRADVVAPHNRFVRALGDEGRARLEEALAGAPELERLALVWRGVAAAEPAVPDPESAWLRLQVLAAAPAGDLVLDGAPDPLALAALVVARGRGGEVRLPLAAQAADALAAPDAPALPDGVAVRDGELVVSCDDAFRVRAARPRAAAAAEEEDERPDQGNSALKRLVLSNLQSTSVTIAFLRDPKVTAVPGLIEEVVNRTRNPQILEIVAGQRALHSGFANRGVPLAMLRSPVNVPVKTLRKFIHVKYISKVDLRRLAADRTGIRREVGKEIEHYLSSLA